MIEGEQVVKKYVIMTVLCNKSQKLQKLLKWYCYNREIIPNIIYMFLRAQTHKHDTMRRRFVETYNERRKNSQHDVAIMRLSYLCVWVLNHRE